MRYEPVESVDGVNAHLIIKGEIRKLYSDKGPLNFSQQAIDRKNERKRVRTVLSK